MPDIKKSFIANGIVNHNCSDPNLQNQPKDIDYRRIYQCPPGYKFIEADFSQAELRAAASLADDLAMKQAFAKDYDIHCATVAAMMKISYEEVIARKEKNDPEIAKGRKKAKSVNFGVVYGETAFSLAEDLGISVPEAEAFLVEYFKGFPGLGRWRDNTQAYTYEHSQTKTLFGRIRRFPELAYKPGLSRSKLGGFMRQAMNTPVQGSASDYSLCAMIAVDKYLKANEFKSKIIAMVHDSIVIEALETEIATIGPQIKHIMETILDIGVKIKADIAIGPIWGFPESEL